MPKVDPLTALADLARRWQAAGFGEVTFPHKPRHGFEALTTPDALYAALAEIERLRPVAEAAADLVTVRGIGHRADSTPVVDALHVLEGACLEAQEQAG